LTEQCGVKILDTNTEIEEELKLIADEDDVEPRDVATFVPIVAQKITELETIKKSVEQRSSNLQKETVPWPKSGDTPVNEFQTEGYITCAFPTLFPTGAGDFVAPRPRTVTAGNYFKHLMMYGDGQFAKHPRFRYFALNTEMRWRALQTGRIYIRKHPKDGKLTLDELKDMVGCEGERFANRVLHFANSLRGTSQYWFKQRRNLISMVDTLGMPTVFFTHSAADSQWPELSRLICPSNQQHSTTHRSRALSENPAIADWFFFHRISKFVEAFYVNVLGAVDYWFRFEWQHRGSPHVHGVAWFREAPDVEKLLSTKDDAEFLDAVEKIISYADNLVSTVNPAISPDASDAHNAPLPKIKPHVCNKWYADVDDLHIDLVELIATCQRHTRCSTAYCLKKKRDGQLQCRFKYPKDLQPVTRIVTSDDGEPTMLTQRNDSLLNSYNPVQLSAWRANVDMQMIVSRRRVINYCAKYATKPEPRSRALKSVYGNVLKSLKGDDASALKVVQKVMISSVGERDFSAQETCHLLLQLPMFRASRDFVVLSLDYSRQLEDHFEENECVTVDSPLEHYCARPVTPEFANMTLLQFVQRFKTSRKVGEGLTCRKKHVVVIVRPCISPDPQGPNYEQYCRQKLMLYQPFRKIEQLLGTCYTHADAYLTYLQSNTVPATLADDILRLEAAERENNNSNTEEVSLK